MSPNLTRYSEAEVNRSKMVSVILCNWLETNLRRNSDTWGAEYAFKIDFLIEFDLPGVPIS